MEQPVHKAKSAQIKGKKGELIPLISLMEHRQGKGKKVNNEFKVQWVNQEPTWETYKSLNEDIPNLLKEYCKTKGIQE